MNKKTDSTIVQTIRSRLKVLLSSIKIEFLDDLNAECEEELFASNPQTPYPDEKAGIR